MQLSMREGMMGGQEFCKTCYMDFVRQNLTTLAKCQVWYSTQLHKCVQPLFLLQMSYLVQISYL